MYSLFRTEQQGDLDALGRGGRRGVLRRRRVQSATGRGRVHQPGEEGGTLRQERRYEIHLWYLMLPKLMRSSLEDCLFKTQSLDRKEFYRLLMTLSVPLFWAFPPLPLPQPLPAPTSRNAKQPIEFFIRDGIYVMKRLFKSHWWN